MYYNQKTLAKTVEFTGIGIHSGKKVDLTVIPAESNHGIKFVRTDLPGKPVIPALFNHVVDTSLATVIGHEGAIVSTIEHLMASFSGLSIDNAIVELNAYEMPILDGSAHEYTYKFKKAGIKTLDCPRQFFVVTKPIELSNDGKFVGIYPFSSCKLTYTIIYNNLLINTQTRSIILKDNIFKDEISRARTFGFLNEYELMKNIGLARGGSLDNVIVIDGETVLNPGGLRYPDEFVRHKILDCIGDFALLGLPIIGHIVVKKSGHSFNQKFVKEFFKQKNSWKTQYLEKKIP